MIGTDELSDLSVSVRANLRPAVAACIMKAANLAITTASNNNRILTNRNRDI